MIPQRKLSKIYIFHSHWETSICMHYFVYFKACEWYTNASFIACWFIIYPNLSLWWITWLKSVKFVTKNNILRSVVTFFLIYIISLVFLCLLVMLCKPWNSKFIHCVSLVRKEGARNSKIKIKLNRIFVITISKWNILSSPYRPKIPKFWIKNF